MMKMGICMSNLTNLWDYRDRGMEVFPVNFPIQDLLKGTKSPEEVAKAIDETCNAALEQGRPK